MSTTYKNKAKEACDIRIEGFAHSNNDEYKQIAKVMQG